MRSGVREFLAHPVDPISLEAALKRFTKSRLPVRRALSESSLWSWDPRAEWAPQPWRSIWERNLPGSPKSGSSCWISPALRARFPAARSPLAFFDPRRRWQSGAARQPFLQCPADASTKKADWRFWQEQRTRTSGTDIQTSALARVVNVAQSCNDYVSWTLGCTYSIRVEAHPANGPHGMLVAEADVPALWTLERHLAKLAVVGHRTAIVPSGDQSLASRRRGSPQGFRKANQAARFRPFAQ